MTFDFYGNRTENGKINDLVDYLTTQEHENWNYCGLTVELDPTVDFKNQNVLIRWTDMEEGFNDRIIVNSLEEFNSLFKKN